MAPLDAAAVHSRTAAFLLEKGSTVGEALQQGEEILRNAGSDTARLDAEVLLAHALDTNRADLLARTTDRLPSEIRITFERLIGRRLHHEPIAYLTHHKAFYGLDFYVDHRVLIPRPETERLVDRTIEIVDSKFADSSHVTVVDVGTGSGCIAVALAVHRPRAKIYALETSESALEVAKINIERHGVRDRVRSMTSDLLLGVAPNVQFDIIVANLPYVSEPELTELPSSVRDYEPVEQALEAGLDGLDLYRRLLDQAPGYLRGRGDVLFEIGWKQGAAAATLARQHFPGAEIRILPDFAGRDRVVEIQTSRKEER